MSKFIFTPISHEDINNAANEAASPDLGPSEGIIKKIEDKRIIKIIEKTLEKG